MSQYSGKMDFTGVKDGRKNKGVAKKRKEMKRLEARSRQQANVDRGYYLQTNSSGAEMRCTPAGIEEF